MFGVMADETSSWLNLTTK